MTADDLDTQRVVWTGRYDGAFPGGLDGWTTGNKELIARVEGATEVLVLDPLSFPWAAVGGERRDVPVVAWLPPELGAEEILLVLGRTLLRFLTPFDRLIEPRPAVRAMLETTLGLSPATWLEAADEAEAHRETVGQTEDAVPPWTAPLAAHLRARLVEVDTDWGRLLAPSEGALTDELRAHGAGRRGAVGAASSLLTPGDVVIDAGAGIGAAAVPFSERVGPDGLVVAVESSSSAVSLLHSNLRRQARSRFLVHRAALGTGAATTTLDDVLAQTDAPSKAQPDSGRGADPLPRLVRIGADSEPDIVAVLAGAERLIAAARPVLCLEVRAGRGADLDAWLAAHDYLSYVASGPRHGRDPSWELRRPESLESVGSDALDALDVVAVARESDLADQLPLRGELEPPSTPGPGPGDVGHEADPAPFGPPHSTPDPTTYLRKRHLRQVAEAVSDDLLSWSERAVGPTLVGVVGRAFDLLPLLGPVSALEVQRQPSDGVDPGPDLPALLVPAPGACLVWLDDGGQSAASRIAVIREAASCLHPGGRLLVVGYVVDAGAGANPSISDLVAELQLATGGAVHVEELQSLHWKGEQLTRGVLLSATSLRTVLV